MSSYMYEHESQTNRFSCKHAEIPAISLPLFHFYIFMLYFIETENIHISSKVGAYSGKGLDLGGQL